MPATPRLEWRTHARTVLLEIAIYIADAGQAPKADIEAQVARP